jgi:DNA-binding CsgD family transcriptional regulator
MPLSLSTAQQNRIYDALQAMTRPLSYDSDVEWRRAIAVPVRRLLSADKVTLVLVGADLPSFSDDFSDKATSRYLPNIGPLLRRLRKRFERRFIPVFDREVFWGPMLEEYFQSSYYHDYIRLIRAFDAIGMAVPSMDSRPESYLGHHLMCHHARPQPEGFGPDALAILQLLYPAFAAGVRTWEQQALQNRALRRLLDRGGLRAALFGPLGRRLHQTPPLSEVLAVDPDGDDVTEAGRALAVDLAAVHRRSTGSLPAPNWSPTRDVRTPVATYRLTASVAPSHLVGPTFVAVVVADVLWHRAEGAETAPASGLPSRETVCDRFYLTPRQAEVALLLAGRHTNKEIADALSISPSTARHHVQAVLEALGTSSRRDVAEKLQDL